MSATALLQKAAQMGATMSKTGSSPAMIRTHQQAHVSADPANNSTSSGNFALNLSSREDQMTTNAGFGHDLAPFGNKAASSAATTRTGAPSGVPPSLLHDVVSSFSSASGFEGTSFEDAFGGILNAKTTKDANFNDTLPKTTTTARLGSAADDGGGGNEGLTRDFLGLRPLSHSDILSIAGIGNCMTTSTSHDQQNQSEKPWQG
ncbi:hypothetical protein L6164_021443 [Bauhinia variegata]|nr:hypothetical protein L6164_021443 [Bauhinia variegata]